MQIHFKNWLDETQFNELKDTQRICINGGFVNCDKWDDYLAQIPAEIVPYVEALRHEIIEKCLRTTGSQHEKTMIPLFSNNKALLMTRNSWGDFMAALLNELEDEFYSYVDFSY